MPARDTAINLPNSASPPNLKKRRFFLFTASGISLLFVVVLVATGVGVYRLFAWLYGGPADQFTQRNETLKTALQVATGFFFALTAFFSLRTVKASEANAKAVNENARIANQNAKTAAENLHVAQMKLDLDRQTAAETLKANVANHTTEQFFKATENLGSGHITTRIGAIFSLERIARDFPDQHQIVFDVLSAFLMQAASTAKITKQNPNALDADALLQNADTFETPDDWYTIIKVIGRRNCTNDTGRRIMLHGCYLPTLWFMNIADEEERCYSFAKVSFKYSCLVAIDARHTDFAGASFYKANLSHADFRGATLHQTSFEDAVLTRTDFRGVDLSHATHLTQLQIESARISPTTTLPPHLCLPPTDLLEQDEVINGYPVLM